jgi:hypothetical protein
LDADLIGRAVLDAAGDRIGNVSTLYVDADTGDVSFAGVTLIRRLRRRIVFVPLIGATLRRASITVRCGKQLARRATCVRHGQTLSAEGEAALFAHYDMPYEPRGGHRVRRLSRYA